MSSHTKCQFSTLLHSLLYMRWTSVVCCCVRATNGSHFTFNSSWPGLVCMISQICHPLLPMALTVGQTMSCARLKKMQICCLDPKRISISGKIKVFCFDKTGTLTKVQTCQLPNLVLCSRTLPVVLLLSSHIRHHCQSVILPTMFSIFDSSSLVGWSRLPRLPHGCTC